ncbi:NUDIX domain-containing protein [Bacillus sp. Xin]|uniref:NUDIX hydrolase n=1 Tax=unclassified Bacillus (in: firmicutes) TaxID=185979 RepID=UPI00157284AF|nr:MULTISPECIES: NUDIX domain-containing protein [unclassified Bacillus (in: firmicutes)]MBC6972835.1 NUDIX domain-containing protein [Bacillus sp. Xin]NSW37216.1 NUDIX domain-containing protein [Bacillus sp. Xin1]
MIRNRGAGIIIQGDKIALIKRIRNDEVYFVFPGGGIEEDETPEEATVCEAYEELGVHIEIQKLVTKYEYKGTQYFYEARIMGGVLGTGKAEEFTTVDRGQYIPVWIPIQELFNLNIKPYEIAKMIVHFYKSIKSDDIQ